MPSFLAEFVGSEPVWGEVEVIADNAAEGMDIAYSSIYDLYPDYEDVEITRFKEINA